MLVGNNPEVSFKSTKKPPGEIRAVGHKKRDNYLITRILLQVWICIDTRLWYWHYIPVITFVGTVKEFPFTTNEFAETYKVIPAHALKIEFPASFHQQGIQDQALQLYITVLSDH
jgi:hypothetical protein